MLTEKVVSEGNNMFFRAKMRYGWFLKKACIEPFMGDPLLGSEAGEPC